jgi:hypothetical protein
MIRELLRRFRPGLEPDPEPVPWAIEKYDTIPSDELRK